MLLSMVFHRCFSIYAYFRKSSSLCSICLAATNTIVFSCLVWKKEGSLKYLQERGTKPVSTCDVCQFLWRWCLIKAHIIYRQKYVCMRCTDAALCVYSIAGSVQEKFLTKLINGWIHFLQKKHFGRTSHTLHTKTILRQTIEWAYVAVDGVHYSPVSVLKHVHRHRRIHHTHGMLYCTQFTVQSTWNIVTYTYAPVHMHTYTCTHARLLAHMHTETCSPIRHPLQKLWWEVLWQIVGIR